MILQLIRNLQKPLILFLVSFFIATALFLTFHTIRQSSIEEMQVTKTALQSAKARYNRALRQKNIYESYELRFIKLTEKGVFAEENRLDWIDAIETTSQRYQIPYVKYTIDNINRIKSNSLDQTYPGIEAFKSTMKLDFQLLHEADLYRFINGLNRTANGLFDIEQCAITRNLLTEGDIMETKHGKNFSANCTLNWYTIRQKTFDPAQSLTGNRGL